MLVLTRRTGEEIVINQDVRVRILKVDGGRVHVGLDAPREVRILRGELAWDDRPEPEQTEIALPR